MVSANKLTDRLTVITAQKILSHPHLLKAASKVVKMTTITSWLENKGKLIRVQYHTVFKLTVSKVCRVMMVSNLLWGRNKKKERGTGARIRLEQ